MSEHPQQTSTPAPDGLVYVIDALGRTLRETDARLTEVTQMNTEWQQENLALKEHIEILQQSLLVYQEASGDQTVDAPSGHRQE